MSSNLIKANARSNGSFTPITNDPFKNAATNIKNVAVNTANAAKNATVNAANAVKNNAANAFNAFSNSMKRNIPDVYEPVNASINESINNGSEPFFTVPVILTLGILLILLVLIIMFRAQISMFLDYTWLKTKEMWRKIRGEEKPIIPEPRREEEKHHKGPHHREEKKDGFPMIPMEMPNMHMNDMERMLPGKKEVFNVAQDKYTFNDAEPLCKAFGAELATYDQVKEAWKKGADWCNYGWIKGQAAVFPTQEETFNKLQTGADDQKMSCGVPGVNGGYFDNPELRFGVNCYGSRPAQNENDMKFIMSNKNMTPGEIAYDKKILDYKAHKNQIPVNPFKKPSM